MYVNTILTLLNMNYADSATLFVSLCMDAHQCLMGRDRWGMITQISHLEWPETQKV